MSCRLWTCCYSPDFSLSQKYDFKSEAYYERIKDRVPELKNWDGIYNWEEMTKKEEADYLSDEGHYWVVDGYCRLFCKAKNKRSGEIKNIVANYVHCNAGWHGINNGYYIDGLFTFNNPKLMQKTIKYVVRMGKTIIINMELQCFITLCQNK